jgi:hypothetical protein
MAGPAAPGPSGPVGGPPILAPSTTPAEAKTFETNLARATDQLKPMQLERQATTQQIGNADAISDLLGRTRLGWGADTQQEGGMILKFLGVSDDNVKKFLGGTDTTAGGALQKLFLTFSSGAVRDLGSHEAASVLGQFARAYPSLESDPAAAQLMTNALRMQAQWKIDRADAAERWEMNQQQNKGAFGQNYKGLAGFDESFNKTNDYRDYWRAAAAMSASALPAATAAKSVAAGVAWKGISPGSPEEQRIYDRIPAGRTFRYSDGNLYTKPGAQ